MADGKVVGLFVGRMEFGPRALGHRSIIGDPRSPAMQSIMNLKIKYRESFRPFAPAVLAERAAEWFDIDVESPYMMLVAEVRRAPAHRRRRRAARTTCATGSTRCAPRSPPSPTSTTRRACRPSTASRAPSSTPILSAFEELTGCPVMINTSFNVRGEPIVCTPEDAYRCFMRTEMDHLVLGAYVLDKRDQPAWAEDGRWQEDYVLD